LKKVLTLMQRWGFTLVGILLILCGLIYAAIPQKTPYQGITKAFLAHYLSGRGIGYMQLEKSSVLYIVNEGDFLPAFSADYLNHGNILISFLYRTDETISIDVSSSNHVHLVGQAFPVVRITLYHQYGQQPVVFSSHEYSQNTDGYYQHNWTVGIGSSILGIIFIGLGYLMISVREKKKKKFDVANTTKTQLEEVESVKPGM
jgi:uncharacterized membrane protein